jgi:hypothetical protein
MKIAKRNHETWELGWAQSSLSVVGWDKEFSTGWRSFASWSSFHRVHQEIQALSQEVLEDMSFPSRFKSLQFGFPKAWMQSLIVPIFKNGDKSNSSNTRTVLITPFIANLYRTILKRKIR